MLNRLTKLREERAAGDKGFTLIELLVVVVIIGILIAIAIPLYLNYQKGAKDKSASSDVRGAISAIEQCFSDNNAYPDTGQLDATGALDPCDVTISISDGTTLGYKNNTTSYQITGQNSGGKFYNYDSAAGGSVKSSATALVAFT